MLWGLGVFLLFWVGCAYALGFASRDPRRDVLAFSLQAGKSNPTRMQKGLDKVGLADTTFAVWLVSRNAYTLLHHPFHLFDTEHCAPAKKTMTLGEPMITMGLLAVPAYLLTGDPILTYNLTLCTLWAIGALAVYLLIVSWTAVPAAGIVAGFLYVLLPAHARDVTHPTIYDMAWTIFAIFFSQRLFAHGRWRDAIGLAASIVLQLGASFYPFLAAFFLAPPYVLWLLVRYRFRHVRWTQLAFVVLASLAGGAAVYGPYLSTRRETDMLHRSAQFYTNWASFLPSGPNFLGWMVLVLMAAAFALGRRRALANLDGDPRWSLLVGGLLVALAATGGTGITMQSPGDPLSFPPNVFALTAAVVPGLDSVRAVFELRIGVHVAACILAGLGAAAVLRLVGKRWTPVGSIVLVCVAAIDVFRPAALGFEPRTWWRAVEMRPSEETLEFYEELARRGNRGPLLEVPMGFEFAGARISRLLLSAWHHRRTSHCFGSFRPPELARVAELSERLPDGEALAALRRLGFTTIIVHQPRGGRLRRLLDDAAREHPDQLRLVYEIPPIGAYAIGPMDEPGSDGRGT